MRPQPQKKKKQPSGANPPLAQATSTGPKRRLVEKSSQNIGQNGQAKITLYDTEEEQEENAQDDQGQEFANPQSFEEVVALFEDKKEMLIASNLRSFVSLVSFKIGQIEFYQYENATPKLAGDVGKMLSEWTGQRWIVTLAPQPGEPSLQEQEKEAHADMLVKTKKHPDVERILKELPDIELINIRKIGQTKE